MSTARGIDTSAPYWELIKPIPPVDKLRLGGEILSTYVRARWLLATTDLPSAVAALRDGYNPPVAVDETDLTQQASGVRLGLAVAKLLRLLPFDSRCLARSLVLTALLARRGIPGTLVIGVGVEPKFAAHAWVESNGIALLAPMDDVPHSRILEI